MRGSWVFVCLILVFGGIVSGAYEDEGLTEMLERKARYSTASFPVDILEDSDTYVWQPETLMYTDSESGHEVWVLVHQGDNEDIYSKEHGSNAWSFDGSSIGFRDSGKLRDSQNPNSHFISDRYLRWIVNVDGSFMRSVDGNGKFTFGFQGFDWARTENAYYAFGGGTGAYGDGEPMSIYKVVLSGDNTAVFSELILDTGVIDDQVKTFVKDGIGDTDSSLVFFASGAYNAKDWNTPNPIDSTRTYFAKFDGVSWNMDSYWGVARHIGPSTNDWEDPYSDHLSESEIKFHDVWSPGPSGLFVVGDYSGTSSLFVWFKNNGSASDGGPLWKDWDGDSFGEEEEIKVISSGSAGSPDNPYSNPYFGHPVFDRWGRYGLIGTYTDNPLPGTKIYDLNSNSFSSEYVMNYGHYDGQHHSWNGWTDYVIGIHPGAGTDDDYKILMNKWNSGYTEEKILVNTHYPGAGESLNYNGYPRPSQSPDGTKVAFAGAWLNNDGDDYPYIQWVVAHYPYPPVNLSAVYSSGVKISWIPPTYTTRGWPNESVDPAPYAREIKKYHVWRTDSLSGPWIEIGSVDDNYYVDPYYSLTHDLSELYYVDNPGDGIWYYALTSEENSRLESRNLSEVLRVGLSGSSIVESAVVRLEGESNFWTSVPGNVTGFNYSVVGGYDMYNLTWVEPSDDKVRYYNIYYSTGSEPEAEEAYRIASLPVGTKKYIDYLADPDNEGYYGITSVDRQGNEGELVVLGEGIVEEDVVCAHDADVGEPCDGVVSIEELRGYLDLWLAGGVSISEVMGAIGAWVETG